MWPWPGKRPLVPVLISKPELNALVCCFTQHLTVPLVWITGVESPN
jgi:hypothetical protein